MALVATEVLALLTVVEEVLAVGVVTDGPVDVVVDSETEIGFVPIPVAEM